MTKAYRVMRMERELWLVLLRERTREPWWTVSKHSNRTAARAAKAALQRNIPTSSAQASPPRVQKGPAQ